MPKNFPVLKPAKLILTVALIVLSFSANAANPYGPPGKPSVSTNRPNIVIILLDDVGFAASSTFGGLAKTPTLSALASVGLRYTNFHNASICSSTRASLLSGRNHHLVGFGTASELATMTRGYDGVWRKNVASLPEILRRNGYNTAAFGKWHNTPPWEKGPMGPFDRWPTGLGFEYFYGFLSGAESQWEPRLFRNTVAINLPKKKNYHLTSDLTDEAIKWIDTHEAVAPDNPYLLYFAPGATHSPHHAPREYIDAYRGAFDKGWDVLRAEVFERQLKSGIIPPGTQLSERPDDFPAWDSLSDSRKRLYSRQMEVFAGFLTHTDREIGRLLKAINRSDHSQNTLIIYMAGDNGAIGGPGIRDEDLPEALASLEELGGLSQHNNYVAPWAWVNSTPFRGMKTVAAYYGGTTDGVVISWPARIKDGGGVRHQFAHVVDVAPTIYEITGIEFPSTVDGVDQVPLSGSSFAGTFSNPKENLGSRTQYFEQLANRAVYQDGWIAAAQHSKALAYSAKQNFESDKWMLFNVEQDISQSIDLAKQYPKKLAELKSEFHREAQLNNVLPLRNSFPRNLIDVGRNLPSPAKKRCVFDYRPGIPRLPLSVVPSFRESYTIRADVFSVNSNTLNGTIISVGGRDGGFAMYVKDGYLIYEENMNGAKHAFIKSASPIPSGKVELKYIYKKRDIKDGVPAAGHLFIDDVLVGESRAPISAIPSTFFGSFTIGGSMAPPVSSSFGLPFKFSGDLESVRVELDCESDQRAELEMLNLFKAG